MLLPRDTPAPAAGPTPALRAEPVRFTTALAKPGLRSHRVVAGDTLEALARRYGIAVETLAAANGLVPPYTLRVGSRLDLPSWAVDRARTYVVRPGDTLAAVAARFGTTVRALATASSISNPDHILAGQTLIVLPDELVPRRAAARPRVSRGPSLLTPVRGEVVEGFAEADGGLEIAAAGRALVHAAADGTVVYAGPGLGGTAVVLLRHNDGGVGVYARADEVFVVRGDRVRRGAAIARLPDGDRPRLRFELRENGRKVDPSRRLSALPEAAQLAADGGLAIEGPAAVEIATGAPAADDLPANGLAPDELAADTAPSFPRRSSPAWIGPL